MVKVLDWSNRGDQCCFSERPRPSSRTALRKAGLSVIENTARLLVAKSALHITALVTTRPLFPLCMISPSKISCYSRAALEDNMVI